eukprot:44964-Eustigmatos_ZCMA.PRE.1
MAVAEESEASDTQQDSIVESLAAVQRDLRSMKNTMSQFKKQLKFKDEEYVKALKKYGEDVEDLLKRMRKEVKELQQHYEVKLNDTQ